MQFHLPPVFRNPTLQGVPLVGANWGHAAFKVPDLRDKVKGKLKIGICDTGCDPSHPALTNLKGSKDFTRSRYGADDYNGHGTHCTGTVGSTETNIGVAAGFDLYHAKGLSDQGSGSMTDLLNGMRWLAEQGCEIISCSWGGGGTDDYSESVYQELLDAGIWCVFAAGNSGGGTQNTDWPGQSLRLINVSALQENLEVASFASAGEKMDTSYAGTNIISCKPRLLGGGYQSMSGTSMATPGCAGLLGLYRQYLKENNRSIPNTLELREKLKSRSTDTGASGDDRRTGPGWITPILLEMDAIPDPSPLAV
jgi:subtilisin